MRRSESHHRKIDHPSSSCNVWKLILLSLAFVSVISDLSKHMRPQKNEHQNGEGEVGSATVWASWIGEVPTAAELYGGEGSSAFEDDDDDDDSLDSAASNEYPDGEYEDV